MDSKSSGPSFFAFCLRLRLWCHLLFSFPYLLYLLYTLSSPILILSLNLPSALKLSPPPFLELMGNCPFKMKPSVDRSLVSTHQMSVAAPQSMTPPNCPQILSGVLWGAELPPIQDDPEKHKKGRGTVQPEGWGEKQGQAPRPGSQGENQAGSGHPGPLSPLSQSYLCAPVPIR